MLWVMEIKAETNISHHTAAKTPFDHKSLCPPSNPTLHLILSQSDKEHYLRVTGTRGLVTVASEYQQLSGAEVSQFLPSL